MRQKFLPYCEPSPHSGLCRYLPCPQCRLVESTIVQVSRIADFESPQSRAIQDSAMQSGGARNALPVFSATGLGRLARREVCGVCRYLRCLQRGAAESATGAGHTKSLWHVESALWSVQVPAVSAMRSCGERKVLPVLSAMSPCLVPAGKSTVPSV